MQLNLQGIPDDIKVRDVQPGDLYLNQRGEYWLVVSVSDRGDACQILIYDQFGKVKGATRYGGHYVRERRFVGTVELPTLDVSWSQ